MRVYKYFRDLNRQSDLSLTAHLGAACFLGACHTTMLTWLKKEHEEKGLDGQALLPIWHHLVEQREDRTYRDKFFSEVVEQAKTVSH